MFLTLLSQTTISHRYVEQHHVLLVLILVQNVVHVTQVLADGCVNTGITLILTILCGEHHLRTEGLVDLRHCLSLIVGKIQALLKAFMLTLRL